MSKKTIFKLAAFVAYVVGLYMFGRKIEQYVDNVAVAYVFNR